jgi:hypothetical protein
MLDKDREFIKKRFDITVMNIYDLKAEGENNGRSMQKKEP